MTVRSVEGKDTTGRDELRPSHGRSKSAQIAYWVRKKPMGSIGAFIIGVMGVLAVLAPVIAQHDPYALSTGEIFHAPGSRFWLGTDEYGRDVFSRIVYGARISLFVGLVSVLLGTSVGGVLGLISGYFGRSVDSVIQRVMDALLAFPTLVLALGLIAALGQSVTNVILAIALVLVPTAARVIRSSVLSVRSELYVESARAIGSSDWRVVFVHILPNCMAPFIVLASIAIGTAILIEASLSFLGLGSPPPEPSWGAMLSGAAQRYIHSAPWMAIFPGLAISLAVFAFNMFGDALRDVLDPRMRSR